jgi:hypothetical protein
MSAESREMLLTKLKESVDAYFDVLLKDKNLKREDRMAELDQVRTWLEEKWAAVEGERSET